MNKSGIFCVSEPLNILVIKNLMKENEFDNINIGDTISVRVKDKKFNLYDKVIKIIAEIVDDNSPEKKRKINKSNMMHNKSVKITISDNFDDSEDENSSIFSEAEEDEIQSLTSEDDSLMGEEHNIQEENTLKEENHEKNLNKTLMINEDGEEEDIEEEEDVQEDEEEDVQEDEEDEDEEEEIDLEDDDENITEDEE